MMSDGYTILAARATNDPEAIIIETAESGAVVVSQRDRPKLWAKLQAWIAAGGTIAPMTS